MKQCRTASISIGLVLLVAVFVRLWGIGYDLPYVYHPDEPVYVNISQRIFATGDLNPHWFHYPSLFFYINALAYKPYYLAGKLSGEFSSPKDISAPKTLLTGVSHTECPSAVLLGRCVTVLFGVGTVALVIAVGTKISGNGLIGLLAGVMLAVSPTSVGLGRLVTPDTFVMFFAVASLLMAGLVYHQGKTWHYVLAGLCVGLTASTKYNGSLVLVVLLAAHILREGKGAFQTRGIYLALLACGIGFLATTPYAILDFSRFWKDLEFERRHYSTGHAGMEGDSARWYLGYMWDTAGVFYVIAALEIVRGVLFRIRKVLLLAVFPVAYFLFISSFEIRNDRTLIPLIPFLYLLAASFLVYLTGKSWEVKSIVWRRVSVSAVASIFALGLISSGLVTTRETVELTTVNSRETARVWIEENLPMGSKVALEAYSPYLDPKDYSIEGIPKLINFPPDWYVENGFDYLVFAEGMFGRFYENPKRYKGAIAQYKVLFNRFDLEKQFDEGGVEVRIYSVR